VQAFLDAMTAQAALSAAGARETAAQKLAVQAEAAQRVGTAAMPERLDAEARRDLAKADRLRAENDLDQARSRLASLIGSSVDGLNPPQFADVTADLANMKPEAWEEKAAAQALPVQLAGVQFGVAEQGKRKALGGALPKVEAFGQISRDRSSDTILNRGVTVRDQAIGVQVKMPLYAGGGTTAQMRKSEKEALQAEFLMADDVRLARLTARQAFLAMRAAGAQLEATRQSVLSTSRAADAAHLGHDVGLRSISEVLDADERTFTAQKNLAAASAQYVFAALQLRASVGELTGRPLPAVFGELP